VVILGTMVYGSAGRSNRHFRPGPKVAIVQHDFPMYVDNRAGRASPNMIFNGYLELARKAAAEKPDLIIMPETAIACFINDEFLDATPDDLEDIRRRRYPMLPKGSLKNYQRFSRGVRDAFQKLCTESGVPIVLGFSSLEWKPKAIPPRVEAFNSAFLMEPGKTRPVTRYDKVHLVLFGEYVPFRYSHRSIYEWLNSLTPWGAAGAEYSLTAGSDYTVFEFDAASGDKQHYRAAVPICYEEIMPYIARRFVRGNGELDDMKHIDMLLTISNDGWFLHTAELEQHLASAVFRAIENRIAVARSVNTGASGQIHPNGKIHALVKLSPENIERLEPVAAALHRIEALLDRLKDRSQADAAYGQTFEELQRVFSQDLLEAVLAMGPEFSFMVERQSPLIVALTVKNPDDRRQAVRALRRQIEDDLNVVARWKKRPWTAPGYIVANLQLDDRVTLYSRWGDWFAQGTAALFVMMLLDWLLRRLLRGKNTARAGQREGTRKENVEPQPRRGAE
jgi:apolipoprotein N-acyltransferase